MRDTNELYGTVYHWPANINIIGMEMSLDNISLTYISFGHIDISLATQNLKYQYHWEIWNC